MRAREGTALSHALQRGRGGPEAHSHPRSIEGVVGDYGTRSSRELASVLPTPRSLAAAGRAVVISNYLRNDAAAAFDQLPAGLPPPELVAELPKIDRSLF